MIQYYTTTDKVYSLYEMPDKFNKSKLTLRYTNPTVEQDYLTTISDAKKIQMTFTMSLTFLLYLLYLAIDTSILPRQTSSSIILFHISILVMCFFLIPSIYFNYFKKLATLTLYLMPIYAVAGTLFLSISNELIYYTEVYVILFWALVAIGYMFLESVIIATLIVILSATMIYYFNILTFEKYLVHLAYLISSWSIGVLVSFIVEQQNRENFENKIAILDMQTQLKDSILEKTSEQEVLLSLFDTGDTVLFNWRNDDVWSIKTVSSNVSNLLLYTQEEFESNQVVYSDCIHPDDLEQVSKEVLQASNSNISFFKHEPYRVLNKEGQIRWVLDYTTIVRNSEGEITNYVGILTDITELRHKDQLLLQHSRLAQMGEMISMIAHQWRQPLSAISSAAINMQVKLELHSFDLDKIEQRDALLSNFNNSLENINKYVQNLTLTINDFRDFYKPNKESVKVKLEDVVIQALNIIQASLNNDNIEVIQNYCCEDSFDVYKNELMQVVLNILKNSQDNFQEKQIENPRLVISTHNKFLSICDNGGGIDEKIIDKVFDPYFSTKDELNGTGLGLYMSKTIVEDHHNGTLDVVNVDDGVCFRVRLGDTKLLK